jgi:hypothetical protein
MGNAPRIFTLLAVLVAIGAALFAYQQTQRAEQSQTDVDTAGETLVAIQTQMIDSSQNADATIVAIGETAQTQIDDVRAAASTLQAGSIGTRSGLEAQGTALQSTAIQLLSDVSAQATQSAATQNAASVRATQASATQAAQATALVEGASALEALQETATADSILFATQASEMEALSTQIAALDTPASAASRPTATPAIANATPTTATQTTDARVRRDTFLAAFAQSLNVEGVEWAIARDPEFRLDGEEEASVALLLVTENGERAILNVFFGNDAARYEALAEGAVTSLELTLFDEQPTGFPSPSYFGSNQQAYEALWSDDTILTRVTVLIDVPDGETKLIALARSVLALLRDV